jgi:hypothetical protein
LTAKEKKRIKELTKEYSDDKTKLDEFLKNEYGLNRV